MDSFKPQFQVFFGNFDIRKDAWNDCGSENSFQRLAMSFSC